jgi:hypothetical protein
MSVQGGLRSLSAQKPAAKLLPDRRLETDADLLQINVCVVAATDMERKLSISSSAEVLSNLD